GNSRGRKRVSAGAVRAASNRPGAPGRARAAARQAHCPQAHPAPPLVPVCSSQRWLPEGVAMRLTKLGHACTRFDKDGAVLVIDPGAFSDPQALAGANAVLITHEHFDHIEPERLRAALEADPGLHLWSTAAVAEQFSHLGVRVHTVGHGDTFSA